MFPEPTKSTLPSPPSPDAASKRHQSEPERLCIYKEKQMHDDDNNNDDDVDDDDDDDVHDDANDEPRKVMQRICLISLKTYY